jgi:membrane protein DedA with SNARE-associated domain
MTNAGSTPRQMQFMASGLEFAITLLLGFGLGYLIDLRVDRQWMLFSILGAAMAFFIGLYRLVSRAKRVMKESQGDYQAIPPEPDREETP